jgi:hypothetical protein
VYLYTQEFRTKLSTDPDTDYVLDVTNWAQSQYQGDKVVSICMVDTTNNGTDVRFWSSRNLLATGPQLLIYTGAVSTVTLTSPIGGEVWAVGSVENITWTSNLVNNIKIEFTSNSGTTWSTVVASTPAAPGTYAWTAPAAPSTKCKVRISDASNASLSSSSPTSFTIFDPNASITVTSPDGGENWVVGSARDISWNSNGVTSVRIEYTTNNGTAWYVAANNVPATPAVYNWTVPYPPTTQAKIKISDATFPNINDISNGVFTISDLPNTMLYSTANCYVKAGTAVDSNFAADTILRVRGSTDTNTIRKSYIKFDLSAFAGTIAKAYLHIWVNRVVAITGGLINRSDFFGVSNDAWNQSTITWRNAPARDAFLMTSEFAARTSTQGDTLYRFDITNYVQSEFAGNKIVTICMVDTINNGTDLRFWSSRPLASVGPALVIYTTTDVQDDNSLPSDFNVSNNYPNPFNPSTTINYTIPFAGNVKVAIYDILGNQVRVLEDRYQNTGTHKAMWDGINNAGQVSASGIYFCRVQFGNMIQTIKLALSK